MADYPMKVCKIDSSKSVSEQKESPEYSEP